jgi:molybdenum cofactor guanylyltransferase
MRLGGAILAGGEGRRMGGTDKPSLILGDRRLIDHVAARLRPQVEILAISANGDTSRFADLGLDVRADDPDRRAGPLAGLATMLDHFAAGHPGISHLLTAPADAPFLPDDLAERLADALDGPERIAIAASDGRDHPVAGLWPIAIRGRLEHHLANAERLSIMAFLDQLDWQSVPFPVVNGVDPFLNVNTQEDLRTARRLLAELPKS